MAQQVNVNVRMDREVKAQADSLFNDLGFNFTTAINAFVKQALRERAIPFYIRATTGAALEREALKKAFASAQGQSVINGTDGTTMEEIDAEIAAYRQGKRR